MSAKRYRILFLYTLTACLLCINTATGRLSFHLLSAPLLTTFLISWLTSFIPNKIARNTVQILLGECVICICMVDCYCQLVFSTPISPQIISNVFLSDLREIWEFLSVYVGKNILGQWRLVILVLLSLSLPVVLLTDRLHFSLNATRTSIPWIIILVICFVVEIPSTYRYYSIFLNKNRTDNIEGLIFRHYDEEKKTPLHRFIISSYTYLKSSDELKRIRQSTFKADIDSCTYKSPHIVLVIGESYNKHHSSLYGYRLPTATNQQKRLEKGELFLFTDVVTPWNITSNVFLNMFSMWESGNSESLADCPLFPVLFRRAGYEVSFFTNQYNFKGFNKGTTSQTGHFFLADRTLCDTLFTFRNEKSEKYDLGLVRQVESYNNRNHSPYTLDIIHLIGQHFDYSQRYTDENRFFKSIDYKQIPINEDERQTIMHYDNATRYNDIVLENILTLYEKEDAIVVFVPDHGEEVYDDLTVSGRLFQKPTVTQAKYEYEVPMWIWCSDLYRETHPDVVSDIIESVSKPFMTDGIPQLLLFLSGIDCKWTNENSNIISDKYESKPRIINGDTDYDILMKSY